MRTPFLSDCSPQSDPHGLQSRPNQGTQSGTHAQCPLAFSPPASGIFRVAVKQFDRYALRPTQETDLDAGPRRMRLLGEFDTFLLEVGGDRVDAGYSKSEMVESLIGRDRCRIHTVARRDLGGEDHCAAKLDIDAWLALL